MIKKLAIFFVVFFTAAAMFTGCPGTYEPIPRGVAGECSCNACSCDDCPCVAGIDCECLPRPGGWQHNVRVPANITYLQGQALGYQWWQASEAVRPMLADRFVTVTFNFANGQLTSVDVDTQFENTTTPPEQREMIAAAIAGWTARVQGGFQNIPDELPWNPADFLIRDNPYHNSWPPNYVDAFSGATVTVNALSLAAFRALEPHIEMPECDTPGCACPDMECPGGTCDCTRPCDHANCECTGCDAAVCTCDRCVFPNCVCTECECTDYHCGPHIRADGYWWVGNVNTGVQAQGPPGTVVPVTGIAITGDRLFPTAPGTFTLLMEPDGIVTLTANVIPPSALIQTLFWELRGNGVEQIQRVARMTPSGRLTFTDPSTAMQVTAASTPGTATIYVTAFGSGAAGVTATINVIVGGENPFCECAAPCDCTLCGCPPFIRCEYAGCVCVDCPYETCDCYSYRCDGCICGLVCHHETCECYRCDIQGCNCAAGDCRGEACTCRCPIWGCGCGTDCLCVPRIFDDIDNADVVASAQSLGYMYAAFLVPGTYVEVTLGFLYDGELVYVSIDTQHESAHTCTFRAPPQNWVYRVRTGGIQAIPPIFPFDYESMGTQPHLWPGFVSATERGPYLDAFSGATVTVNALTRAAHGALRDAIEQLPPNTLPPGSWPPGFSP